jgi:hypothetical protein
MTAESNRPALDLGGAVSADARVAITQHVEELQAGWNQHNPDISNRHVAADVLWGSPFGRATLA